MIIIQRLIYKQITIYTILFSIGLSMLFVFFALTEELGNVGSGVNSSYSTFNAVVYTVLSSLINLQEIVPISTLIASIYVLSKLAVNSEFTILRTSGLSPTRMLKMLLILGLFFSCVTLFLSDYATPKLEKFAEQYKLKSKGITTIPAKNLAWLKTQDDKFNHIVNIEGIDLNNEIYNISIYSFNKQGRLAKEIYAKQASINKNFWVLKDVEVTQYQNENLKQTAIEHLQLKQYRWANNISLQLIRASFVKPNRMNIIDLYKYSEHLKQNNQEAQNYQIAFWIKIFYSLSCLVMLIMALPFAYLHFRSSNVSFYIFIGVILGLSFFMLINITEYLTKLNHWTPWFATMVPNLIYSFISLCMFTWLIRNR